MQYDGYFLVLEIQDIGIINSIEAISDIAVELGLIQNIQTTVEGYLSPVQ